MARQSTLRQRHCERIYDRVIRQANHQLLELPHSAGYNIYPSEIEELLGKHFAVAEAAVVSIPDERRNEVPKAYVITRPGVELGVDMTSEELKQYCLDNIAEYKHPREVTFIDELPRTASGKIQKFKLEDRYREDDN